MKIITEADLRSALLSDGTLGYRAPAGARLTPQAREYLARRGIAVIPAENDRAAPSVPVMPVIPITNRAGNTYRDAETGRGFDKKPEEMTHLRANLLVPKSHPRIALRGQLDSLEAHIICLEVITHREGLAGMTEDLEDALRYTRQILAAEVKDAPLGEMTLFGLGPEKLRELSHNVRGELGIPHPVPSYTFGEAAAGLNLLRTRARECELAAVRAFGEGKDRRPDIIRALNRLSSGFYILFCRHLAGMKSRDGGV